MAGWYGFDLDGTLALHTPGSGIDRIGEPVPAVLERLLEHLLNGDECRIMTARVGNCGNYSPESRRYANDRFTAEQVALIEAWCERHVGRKLPVTASKDFAMRGIYDDRATAVEANTGRMFSWGDPICPCGREVL